MHQTEGLCKKTISQYLQRIRHGCWNVLSTLMSEMSWVWSVLTPKYHRPHRTTPTKPNPVPNPTVKLVVFTQDGVPDSSLVCCTVFKLSKVNTWVTGCTSTSPHPHFTHNIHRQSPRYSPHFTRLISRTSAFYRKPSATEWMALLILLLR